MPFSKSGPDRLAATAHACLDVDAMNIPGAFVECGVWKGGNVMVARWASPARQCWLYDTFAGMTEPGPHDIKRGGGSMKAGKATASRYDVVSNLKKVGVFDPLKLHFVAGDVRKTLNDAICLPDQIAVLRLDTDFYDSTKIELEILYPRLSPGGYLIVDDYGHWLGARKAVDEYLGEQSALLKPIDYTGHWMIKR